MRSDHHAFSNPGILVDDGILDHTVAPDTDGNLPGGGSPLVALEIVSPHHDDVPEFGSGVDEAPDTDDAPLEARGMNLAAVRDHGPVNDGVLDHAGGKESGLRVDGRSGGVKIVLGLGVAEVQVGVKEGTYRPDILPVPAEDVGLNVPGADGPRYDMLSEIFQRVVETLSQDLAVEDIDPHVCQIQLLLLGFVQFPEDLRLHPEFRKDRGILRFLHETGDPLGRVRFHDSEPHGRLSAHRDAGDGQVGPRVDVLLKHVAVVHAVELVAREDDEVLVVPLEEGAEVLPHGIGRSLVPGRSLGSLLGRQDLDKAGGEVVELVAGVDMTVERCAVELRQHVDAPDSGVQAVADGHVHKAVLAPDRHRRFCAVLGQGEETGAGSSSHDDGEGLGGRSDDVPWIHTLGDAGCP